MLLAFLYVNETRIGYVSAQRMATGEDGVNEYDWKVQHRDEHDRLVEEEGFALKHHYQDGALVLISKVLEASGNGP